ncbi:hypothetical protein [Coralliovum pocilloporae]|uniref:hypothetical protein n=1 Tax=Coralliovum pocilloporae TaxID=3066369 RepID=UPI003306CDB3
MVSLMVVLTLQSVPRGAPDISDPPNTTTETVAAVLQDAETGDCCKTEAVADTTPSLCKSDCKALLPTVIFADYHPARIFDFGQSLSLMALGPPVDLPPPIS